MMMIFTIWKKKPTIWIINTWQSSISMLQWNKRERAIENQFNFNHAVSGEDDARQLYNERKTGMVNVDCFLPVDEFECQQDVCSIYEFDTEEEEDLESDWIF